MSLVNYEQLVMDILCIGKCLVLPRYLFGEPFKEKLFELTGDDEMLEILDEYA
jgi:hypothetical protein